MENLKIEIATLEDAEGILNVQRNTWLCVYPNTEHGISKQDIQEKIDGFELKWWKKIASSNNKTGKRVWVAKLNNETVGFGGAMKEGEMNRLTSIYVLPNCQRKGVGKALIEEILKFLGEEKPIVIEVVSYNDKAINFYKKFGFVKNRDITPTRHAKLPSGKMMPEIEMIRRF